MNNLTIRKATPNDFEQMFTLWLEMQEFHVQFDEKWYKPEERCKAKAFEYWNQKLNDDNAIMLVAEKDGDLVGMIISFIITRPPVLENQFNLLFIDNVIISKYYRRLGIFKQMMNTLISIAKEKGVSAINLTVNYENETAIKAYESIGLRKIELGMLRYL
ncbi:MAG: GNAT family N-acetyltransferase [Fibrobacter sp.]|nr:GNAT family N-acetyltransferase [Fibrobacter sp.]